LVLQYCRVAAREQSGKMIKDTSQTKIGEHYDWRAL
jgi:hypothetical protein